MNDMKMQDRQYWNARTRGGKGCDQVSGRDQKHREDKDISDFSFQCQTCFLH